MILFIQGAGFFGKLQNWVPSAGPKHIPMQIEYVLTFCQLVIEMSIILPQIDR